MIDEDEEYLYIPTVTQQKIISLLVIVPSFLSFFGSSLIIYHIINDKRKSPYRRILFSLSIFDIITTFGYLTQPYLMTSNVINSYVWSFGNETSCKALAAISQLAVASHLYSTCLSLYFLLTIRFGVREKTFEKRIEKVMHFLVITFAIGTSITGLVTDKYYAMHVGPGCWFSHPPEGDICENDSCGVGKMAWIFGGFPMLLGVMTITSSNLVLFCYVRSTVKRGQIRCSMNDATVQVGDEDEDTIIQKPSLSQRLSGKFSGRSSGRSTSSRREWQRVKELGNQSFLYVGSHFLCFIWTMTKGALDGEGFDKLEGSGSIFLPLLILQSIFLPIHGFFSMLIYFRPKYLKNRHEWPLESRIWAFRRAVLGDRVRPVHLVPRRQKAVTVSDNVSTSVTPETHFKQPSNGINEAKAVEPKWSTMASLTARLRDLDGGEGDGGRKPRNGPELTSGAFETSSKRPRYQFRSSLEYTSQNLEAISELTESVFDPIMNHPSNQDSKSDCEVDQLENSERRWISCTITASPSIDASKIGELDGCRIDDLVAPRRMESENEGEHQIDEKGEEIDDANDSGNPNEADNQDVCDTPVPIPIRRMSLKSLESSRSFHSSSSVSSSCSLVSFSEEDLEFGEDGGVDFDERHQHEEERR